MRAVDLFAGAGGFTTGAEAAGLRVVWAGDHWPVAVATHEANHPNVAHLCQDLHQANWHEVPKHDVLLASPACQGHTPARGKERPHHDATRSTAWAVVSCAEVHRPRLLVVENVPAYRRWRLFPAWSEALRALGYTLSPHVLDAADYGVPQNRVRLFVIGTRSRKPLLLQARTGSQAAIDPYLDWDGGNWRQIDDDLAANTLTRIADGRRRFGRRFLYSYYGATKTARCVSRPVGTITTHDRWALVDGDRMRMFSTDECRRAMGFPANYLLPVNGTTAKFLLGNAVPPPLAAGLLAELLEVV